MPDGSVRIELIDLREPGAAPRSLPGDAGTLVEYDAEIAPAILTLRGPAPAPARWIRIPDGASVVVPEGCRLLASSAGDAIAQCPVDPVRRDWTYVGRFRFSPQPREASAGVPASP